MKVFVTKYALTIGIEELDVEITSVPTMVATKGPFPRNFHDEGRDWHHTKEEAKTRAEEMRKKKIESLKKSIIKLEAMRF